MSRFRPLDPNAAPHETAGNSPGASKLVPIPHEEYDRQRRQKYIKWGSIAALVALVIGAFLYRSSVPVKALNDYIDARKFFDSGKYTDALAAVNKAIDNGREQARAYQLRIEIYRALHQPKDAVADITRLIELQPAAAENYDLRAQTYLEIDDSASAAKDYTKLIELSKSGQAYNGRGLCYLKLKDYPKAIEDFTQAIERSPSVEFYLQRGLAWSAAGDHRKAVADFDKALDLRADLSTAYRARAAEKQKMGDGPGAERDRQKAISLEKPVLPKPAQVALPKRA